MLSVSFVPHRYVAAAVRTSDDRAAKRQHIAPTQVCARFTLLRCLGARTDSAARLIRNVPTGAIFTRLDCFGAACCAARRGATDGRWTSPSCTTGAAAIARADHSLHDASTATSTAADSAATRAAADAAAATAGSHPAFRHLGSDT